MLYGELGGLDLYQYSSVFLEFLQYPGVMSSYDWSIGTNAALWLVFIRATCFFWTRGLIDVRRPWHNKINGEKELTRPHGLTGSALLIYIGWFIATWEFLVDFSFLNCVRVECWNHYERVWQGWPIIGHKQICDTYWSCALCSFQVDAHPTTRTKKNAYHHERYDIYTAVILFFFSSFLLRLIPNDSEQEPPRYDVVTHHWFTDWRSSMPTELGCRWQETAVAGYSFSCKPKADPQVSLNISLLFCIPWPFLIISSSDLTVLNILQILCDLFCLNI